jgi:hypothetical protein
MPQASMMEVDNSTAEGSDINSGCHVLYIDIRGVVDKMWVRADYISSNLPRHSTLNYIDTCRPSGYSFRPTKRHCSQYYIIYTTSPTPSR